MSAIRCLSSDELRDFVLGQTDDARAEEILAHLSECPACEDTVASLDDTADSLVASVRQAVEQGDADGSPADEAADPLAAALANVRDRFAPSVAAPPLDGSLSRIVERVRDYELVDELGSGGMGTVYKAVHTKLDRTVALKLLPARRLRDQAAVARFEREMKAIGRLDHPAIVRATDAGEVDGTHFLAMDFVDGIDLGKLVRLTGPLDVASACELIRQAAIGLQYAHEQGLIHRDVKPSNLMVERSSRGSRVQSPETDSSGDQSSGSGLSSLDSQLPTVRILDLGLALFGSASEAVDELTTVGQLMGTLDYMAPEQADNSHAVDARADVYSLGATLFKLLAGMAPYETAERCSPLQKMKALATTDPSPIASRCEDLPDGLAEIVDRTLLRDPDERFQSAADVAEALAPFCAGASIGSLVERGLQLAEQQREARERQLQSSHLAPRDEPLAAFGPNGQPPTRAFATPDRSQHSGSVPVAIQNGSSRGARWLLWTALTAVALLAGITIWIQTDTGTLKIECADKNVPIEIRNSSGKVVKSETLSVGQNEIVIHSGSYEIVLPRDYDELTVENGKYELTRGGEWLARVTKQTGGASPSDSALNSGAIVAGVPLTNAEIPIHLQTSAWRIDQSVLRTGALGKVIDEAPALVLAERLSLKLLSAPDSDRGFLVAIASDAEYLVRTLHNAPFDRCSLRFTNEAVQSIHWDTPKENLLSKQIVGLTLWDEDATIALEPQIANDGKAMLWYDLELTGQSVAMTPNATPIKRGRNIKGFAPLNKDQAIVFIELNPEPTFVPLIIVRPGDMGASVLPHASVAQSAPGNGDDEKKALPLSSKLPEKPTTKTSGNSLVFSGRTFEQWQQSVLTERNPEELKNAVMALCILGRQNRDREAAETVLKVTDAYPCEITSSPEWELVAAAIRYLRTLDADAIVPAIVEALESRGTNTRRLIVEHLASGVMYGGGGFGNAAGSSAPSTGNAEPLMSRLRSSPEFRKALVEVFPAISHIDRETANLRTIAFGQIELFLDDDALQTQIDGLLEHIYENAKTTTHPVNMGSYVPKAILHLTRRSPRPELAGYFLDNLERTYSNPPTVGSAAWLPSYSSDWYGLWLLGDKAEAESERIAKLLTEKLPGTFHPSPVQATTVPTTVAGWGDTNSPRQWVTRKVLTLDLLATIGPGAKSAVPSVVEEIEALTGQRPVDDGEYGYEANDPRTFFVQFKAPFSHLLTGTTSYAVGGFGFGGGGVPGTGGGFFSGSDVGPEVRNGEPIVMPETWLRLNAAMRALKSLTGRTPRFATLQLGPRQLENDVPEQAKADPYGGGYPGLSYDSGQQNQPKNEDYDFGHAYANGWVPKLVSYRGKDFAEWAEETLAFQSSTTLNEVVRAIELLGANEKPEAVAAATARVFEAAMSQRGVITEVDRSAIHNSFYSCWQASDGPARGKLLLLIFGGTPERKALVLTEIVAPSLDLSKLPPTTDLATEPPAPRNIEWALPTDVTRELLFAGPFMSRYQQLVDGWDKHGSELRAAILHVEDQLPALGQVNRTSLLETLLKSGSPSEKLAAALIVARIDLVKQQDALLRKQNRDAKIADTPPLQPALKQVAIDALVEAIRERRKELDWANAVAALPSLLASTFDDKLAFEFVDIIEADSTSPESVQPFSLMIGSPLLGGMGDEAGGSGNPFGTAMGGAGLPGMGLGTSSGGGEYDSSGTGSGVAGSSGYGAGAAPGGMAGEAQAKPAEVVHRVLSRRILLLELLTLANKDNAKLKTRLAEVIRRITSQQKPYQGQPLSENVFTSELADFWQNSATFRGTGPATADVESNTFAGVMVRVPIVLGIPAKDLMPDGKPPKADGAARPEPLSTETSSTRQPGNDQPPATYQGRTYDEWFDEVRRERSPSELISGLEALATLGAGKHDEDIAREILTIVTRVNVATADGGSNEALLSATERYLNRLRPETVVPLITEAVRSENPAIVWYSIQRLMPDLSIRQWNAIETKTTGQVSLALYQNADFQDTLLAAWPTVTTEMRPQFVLAASLFAVEAPPEGDLPDTGLLNFLAVVAGGEDTATQVPLKGAIRSSLKLHACRALARIYPSCPELPKWTLDGIEPFRGLTGSEWWYHTSNGWLALVQMGRHSARQTDRLAEWIVDTDEPYRSVIDYAWAITLESGMKDFGGLAIPRRLVMLEALASIVDAENLSSTGRNTLLTLKDNVPEFAAAALDDESSVKRANDEFSQDVEVSALDTLLLPYRSSGSVRMLNFGFQGAEISSLDGARLVIAYRRCQKLIAELLGEAEPPQVPEKQPEKKLEASVTE